MDQYVPKKLLFLFFFSLGLSSVTYAQYQSNWAVGLRVGEPLGLNIRKYYEEGGKTFDVNIGTYGFLYGKRKDYWKGEYKSAGLMVQGIKSWHHSVFYKENFHVYYGFGGQINQRNYFPDSRIGQRDDSEKKISLGPAVATGFEVRLPNNDLGIFIDAGGYLELLPDFFFPNLQISCVVRLNLIR
jgi:hypothetical protein